MKRIPAFLVALLLAATAIAQPVQGSAIDLVPTPAAQGQRPATHELRISLYTFEGTRWTKPAIIDASTEAARVLGQCEVELKGVTLHSLEAPRRFHFYSTPVSRELLRSFAVQRPAVFFVEDTHNRPAFDAETIGLSNSATRPELANTIWFAYGARDLPLALAHELVHLLSDSGEHSAAAGNLMLADTAPENLRLDAAQCERMRVRGEANGLLGRRVVKP